MIYQHVPQHVWRWICLLQLLLVYVAKRRRTLLFTRTRKPEYGLLVTAGPLVVIYLLVVAVDSCLRSVLIFFSIFIFCNRNMLGFYCNVYFSGSKYMYPFYYILQNQLHIFVTYSQKSKWNHFSSKYLYKQCIKINLIKIIPSVYIPFIVINFRTLVCLTHISVI